MTWSVNRENGDPAGSNRLKILMIVRGDGVRPEKVRELEKGAAGEGERVRERVREEEKRE